MNDQEPLSGKLFTAWEYAMLIEEAKEQERFADFYSSIPELIVRHNTLESHLPLIFVISARQEGK